MKNLSGQLANTLLDGAVSSAVGKVGGKLRPLSALIHDENLVRVITEEGKPVARVFDKGSDIPRTLPDSITPMSVDDLVHELATDAELAGLFPASGNSGGGTPVSNTTPIEPAKILKRI